MILTELPNGLHLDVPPEVYHRKEMGLVSKGALEELAHSPAHYKAWVDGFLHDEESAALSFGRAFHCAVLEPERFKKDYACEPNFGNCQKKENKATRDAWRAEHAGCEYLSATDDGIVRGMTAAVHANPLASKMLIGGVAEATLLWNDQETGLRCRARSDYYVQRRGLVVDVKSTVDASPDGFNRQVGKYGYGLQHALYRTGFAAIGQAAQHFVFVAVEKAPPYAVGIYALDEKWISLGHTKATNMTKLLRDCLQHELWPAYAVAIRTLEAPPWAA